MKKKCYVSLLVSYTDGTWKGYQFLVSKKKYKKYKNDWFLYVIEEQDFEKTNLHFVQCIEKTAYFYEKPGPLCY